MLAIAYIFAVLAGVSAALFFILLIRMWMGKHLYDRSIDEKLRMIMGFFFFSLSIAVVILFPRHFDVPVAHSIGEFYYLSATNLYYGIKLAFIGGIPVGLFFMTLSFFSWAKKK